MQIREYAQILWRRKVIILLVVVISTVATFTFSRMQTPIYRSTITLSVLPARSSDLGSTLAIKNLLQFYAQQIQSDSSLQQVIDQLQLDIPLETFQSRIDTASDEANLSLTIEVRDPIRNNPERIAKTLSDVFVLQHERENLQVDQTDRSIIRILKGPTSTEQFSPKTLINVTAGSILGFLVGLFTVFLLEFIESANIRSAEDVEKFLGVTVLGAIPPFPTERKQKLLQLI